MKQKNKTDNKKVALFIFIILFLGAIYIFRDNLQGMMSDASEGKTEYISDRGPVEELTLSKIDSRTPQQLTQSKTLNRTSITTDNWKLISELPAYTVGESIKFLNSKEGFLVTQNSGVYKTEDGGVSWNQVLKRPKNTVYFSDLIVKDQTLHVTGFDAGSYSLRGILWNSYDFGKNWSEQTLSTNQDWLMATASGNDYGLIQTISLYDGIATVWRKSLGKENMKGDLWKRITPKGNQGWFGSQISALPSGKASASGISFCQSSNKGVNWNCRPSVDPIFDGVTYFVNDNLGFVAGGYISPDPNLGWVHRTTDGGTTWTDRLVETPWPIRTMISKDTNTLFAAGGNSYSGIGGIIVSSDGGVTWNYSADTHSEITGCDLVQSKPSKIVCVGIGPNSNTQVYQLSL